MKFSLQDLDSISARLCLEVEKFCQEKLGDISGRTFLLALSGGADSTAMALILAFLAERHKLNLYGMYVNHHLRSEVEKEAQFVQNLCSMLDIPFRYAEIQVARIAEASKIGFEEAGRKARYAALEMCRQELGADQILVAHHAGDLCEDILLRLIRGTGWPALGGMRSSNGFVFRPLLPISRKRLLLFLHTMEQEWCEDLSNQDLSFRRNRIRTNFIPFLRNENPSIERTFKNLHQLSLADEAFWKEYINKILLAHPYEILNYDGEKGLRLSRKAFESQPLAARLRLLHYMINCLISHFPTTERPQIQYEKIVALDKAIMEKASGKIFQFQGQMLARTSRSHIYFLLTLSQ